MKGFTLLSWELSWKMPGKGLFFEAESADGRMLDIVEVVGLDLLAGHVMLVEPNSVAGDSFRDPPKGLPVGREPKAL